MPNSFLTSEGSVPDLRKYQSTDEKIEVLQNYLYQLLEELRYTLHNINADDIDDESFRRRLEESTETTKKISEYIQTIDEIRSVISEKVETFEGDWERWSELRQTIEGLEVIIGDSGTLDATEIITQTKLDLWAQGFSADISSSYVKKTDEDTTTKYAQAIISASSTAIETYLTNNYYNKTDIGTLETTLKTYSETQAGSVKTYLEQNYLSATDLGTNSSWAQSFMEATANNFKAGILTEYAKVTDLSTESVYSQNIITATENSIKQYISTNYTTPQSFSEKFTQIEANAGSIETLIGWQQGLKIGANNLIRGSDTYELAEGYSREETYDKGRWYKITGNGGNATVTTFEMDDPPTSGITHGVTLTEPTGGSTLLLQTFSPSSVIFTSGKEYIISGYRRVNPNSTQDTVKSWAYMTGRRVGSNQNVTLFSWTKDLEKANGWEQFSEKFTVDFDTDRIAYLYIGINSAGSIDYCGLKLEEGNIPTAWAKNEYDIRAAVTTQFKIDLEGITGTVTGIGNVASEAKQTADTVKTTVQALSVGGRNYILNSQTLEGWIKSNSVTIDTETGEASFPAKDANAWVVAQPGKYLPYKLVRNKTVRVSCEWYAERGVEVKIYYTAILLNPGETTRRLYKGVTKTVTGTGNWEKLVYDPIELKDSYFSSGSGLTSFDTADFGVQFYSHNTCWNPFKIRKPKCEAGTMATDWTPAPEDFTTQIVQNAYEITQRVKASEVVSVINQSADKISASAINIDFTGMVTFNDLTNTSKTIINGGVIQTGTILASAIHSSAITTDKLNANSVTAGKIAAGAITTDKLAANAVTTDKLAANCITANQIAANSITTGHLQSKAVTTDKIEAKAITAELIDSKVIRAEHIVSNTITAEQIAANTITASQIAASTITATQIKANTITSNQIAAGTITASNIAAGTITATQIAANTITGAKIAAGTITSTQISSSYVYAGAIKATQISAGTLASNVIYSGAIAASQITSGTISASRIGSETITSGKLRINGTIKFYKDSSATTAYGTIGYATGNDGDSSTDGIRMHVDGTHRLFISNAGAILEGGSRITLKSNLTKCTGNVTCKELTTSGDTYISGGLETVGSVIHLGGSSTTHVYAYSSGELKGQGTVTRNSSGYLAVSSSNRYKKNLERALTSADVAGWYDLPIYHGSYKEQYCHEGDTYYGEHLPMFTVEDIEEICPEANFHNLDGSLTDCSWDYFVIMPIMLKMIQDQKKRIDELEGKVS